MGVKGRNEAGIGGAAVAGGDCDGGCGPGNGGNALSGGTVNLDCRQA